MKIKKGDTVKVITGKDRDKTGLVKEVFRKVDRVLIEGINMVKRHQKKTKDDKQGGIITREAPIHISNIMLVDPKTQKTARVGYKFEANKKIRITKKYNTILK
ncbi:MAG: 50S ribosomal protein L24 [bacterium]